jgi:hypothetical protein
MNQKTMFAAVLISIMFILPAQSKNARYYSFFTLGHVLASRGNGAKIIISKSFKIKRYY